MDAYKITEVHISKIEIGDTVMHNGEVITISKSNYKQGQMIAGDPYHGGRMLVKKVLFPRWLRGELVVYK